MVDGQKRLRGPKASLALEGPAVLSGDAIGSLTRHSRWLMFAELKTTGAPERNRSLKQDGVYI